MEAETLIFYWKQKHNLKSTVNTKTWTLPVRLWLGHTPFRQGETSLSLDTDEPEHMSSRAAEFFNGRRPLYAAAVYASLLLVSTVCRPPRCLCSRRDREYAAGRRGGRPGFVSLNPTYFHCLINPTSRPHHSCWCDRLFYDSINRNVWLSVKHQVIFGFRQHSTLLPVKKEKLMFTQTTSNSAFSLSSFTKSSLLVIWPPDLSLQPFSFQVFTQLVTPAGSTQTLWSLLF